MFLHEMSHVAVAKIFFGARSFKMWLYPHRDEENNFYFARVMWVWSEDPKHFAAMSSVWLSSIWLAPGFMQTVAAIMLPFACLLPPLIAIAWTLFWGAGLVDMGVSAIGIREHSDLRRSAKILEWNPWVIRSAYIATITLSLLTYIVLILVV